MFEPRGGPRESSLREIADAQGAGLLSTEDIVVRTPLGAVSGIDAVKAQVYSAASPSLASATELQCARKSPGVWHVHRFYSVSKSGTEFTLKQDWLVVVDVDSSYQSGGRKLYKPLIAEVSSNLA